MKIYINTSVLSINKLDVNTRWRLANNPNTTVHDLIVLAKDKSSDVRAEVARNANTPSEVLSKLAKSRNYNILRRVAANSNTLPDDLQHIYHMVKDIYELYYSSTIEEALARNPNTPTDVINELSHIYGPIGEYAKKHPNYTGG